MQTYKHPKYIPELEGLRGLAALSVALAHHFGTFCIGNNRAYWLTPFLSEPAGGKVFTLITCIFSPGLAVVLFFILSGFVLAKSVHSLPTINAENIAAFYIKRLFRIFPVHIVCLVIFTCLLLAFPVQPHNSYSDFYYTAFPGNISLKEFIKNLLLHNATLNTVIWTLPIEVVGSLFVPVFCIINTRLNDTSKLLLLLLLVLAGGLYVEHNSIKYLFCFYLGTILPYFYSSISGKWSGYIFVSGLLFSSVITFLQTSYSVSYALDIFRALSGILIIVPLVLHQSNRLKAVFSSRPVMRLGATSYSFYLIHLSVLYLFAKLPWLLQLADTSGSWSATLLLLLSIPTSYLVSKALYQYVEVVFIQTGKKVAASVIKQLSLMKPAVNN